MSEWFFVGVTIGLPIAALLYALYKRQLPAFIFGVCTFSFSQLLIRIPLIEWLANK